MRTIYLYYHLFIYLTGFIELYILYPKMIKLPKKSVKKRGSDNII